MTSSNWVWIPQPIILAVHNEQLAEHGGLAGVRDLGLLESALSRPAHLATYSQPDVAELAAFYGYGIARNHPFIDGNKRTAFVAALLFLALNHYDFATSDTDKVLTMLKVATGEISEAEFAEWIRQHSSQK
ncbi:MAG: type II toxin-antitoxin system death-on-curing family toxin [Methylophilaceae bacterium]|nr:type II toxin-antitoxin system death-on-curing family toxin [Methylophilaceae bacterium]